MDYIKYRFQNQKDNEILLAFLSEFPFNTFQEQEDSLDAFISNADYYSSLDEELEELKSRYPFTFQKETIEYQNWNKIWESNFQVIKVGDYCGIRADFHDPLPNFKHEIIINPKMAFGTGHHATTFMMIQSMESLDYQDTKCLDYGCGTGVLAILAAKEGSKDIDAVDIEEASYENTLENCTRNDIHAVNTYCGTIEAVNSKEYDIILANINRNVILDSFPVLATMLKPKGKLLISGFIAEDEQVVLAKATQNDFKMLKKLEKNNWLCITLERF